MCIQNQIWSSTSKHALLRNSASLTAIRLFSRLPVACKTVVTSETMELAAKMLSYLELPPVDVRYSGMWEKNIMGNNIWLCCWIPCSAEQPKENGAAAGGLQSHIKALNCEVVGLIKGHPVLDSVPKCLKACLCIVCIVLSAIVTMYHSNTHAKSFM